ncbi:MAG: DUF1800 family protein, partial [Bacteroidota bacterium]
MNRRDFFRRSSGLSVEPATQVSAMYAPVGTPRPVSGLGKYTGEWKFEQASHLLRRTMFGPKKSEINLAATLGMDVTVTKLLNELLPVISPVNLGNVSGSALIASWMYSTPAPAQNGDRNIQMIGWWTGLMVNQGISIQQKMALFLHNHLVTSIEQVNDARFSFQYLKLLQDNALGNFKTLVRQMSVNPAMLIYLNGDQNTKASPNENYARELMELFTMGAKNRAGAPNYTEDDVVAAARILTGWQIQHNNIGLEPLFPYVKFNSSLHDNTAKQFSSHFGNKKIHRPLVLQYEKELDDLIDMIFARNETALFMVREIYKWFVYYEIDDTVEATVIVPLANQFRSNGYNLKPV